MSEGRYFWTAVMLLTRLPTPRLDDFQETWLARSAVWFPVVGLLVGCLAGGVFAVACVFWSESVAAVLALAAAALVTGGLHEDGWADVFDAIAAGTASGDRRRMLEVMKDSRIGASGALALILLLLGKLGALATMPPVRAAAALIAAHVLSRWSHLPLLWKLPYARPEGGLAGPLAGRVTQERVVAGTVFAVLVAAGLLRWYALPALAAAAATTLASGLFFRRRLGGITGDCLGAANQLVELSVLLAAAASLEWK